MCGGGGGEWLLAGLWHPARAALAARLRMCVAASLQMPFLMHLWSVAVGDLGVILTLCAAVDVSAACMAPLYAFDCVPELLEDTLPP